MNRRQAALLVTGVAVAVLVALLFVVPVPYAVLGPGPVCDTLGTGTGACRSTNDVTGSLITVSPASADHPDTDGKLGATTVSVPNQEPSLAEAIAGWFSSGHAVVPREEIIPPDESAEDVQKQGEDDMRQAQAAAVNAAEAALGLLDVKVAAVQAGSPAARVLRVGDTITSIDGTTIRSGGQLRDISAANKDAGATFALGIVRDGATQTVQLGRARASDGSLIFGVSLEDEPRGVTVKITLDPNAVGGPSAGLMLALGVYDRLTPGSLTGGAIVAGTGTIDDTGQVGEIGGIQQKMYAARHDFKATVFLAPAGDCGDTKGAVPKGLRVVKVTTFSDALAALAAVRSGPQAVAALPHC